MADDNSVILQIGSYSFSPVPLMTLDKTWIRSESGCPISVVKTATFNGLLMNTNCKDCDPDPDSEEPTDVIGLRQKMDEELCGCNSDSCVNMTISCGDNEWINANVRISNITWAESPDSWTQTIPFSMVVEWDESVAEGDDCVSCLRSVTDEWSFEFLENPAPYLLTPVSKDETIAGPTGPTGPTTTEAECESEALYMSVTHNVSAQAVDCCTTTTTGEPPVTTTTHTPGYKVAECWVEARAGFNEDVFIPLKSFGFMEGELNICNHARSASFSIKGGSFNLSESFIISNEAVTDHCLEEWSIDCQQEQQSRLTTFTISGTITGFEKRDTTDWHNITQTKVESAKKCWENIKNILADRIECCYNTDICPVNRTPTSTSLTFSPTAGTVNYSYTFNDRHPNLIDGSLWESIQFSGNKESVNVSEIPIIGRQQGPILRDCNTQSSRKQTVSIQVIFPLDECPDTGDCSTRLSAANLTEAQETSVESFLCCVEQRLKDSMSDDHFIRRTENTCGYDPQTGIHSRAVTWIYQDCAWTTAEECEIADV